MTDRTKLARVTARAVAQKVAEYLQDCHPGGVTVEVDPDGIQRRESSWRVRVRPSKEPAKLFEYYEALADVELELEEREHLNVWLVTADPEHSPPVEGCPPSSEDKAAGVASVRRRTTPSGATK
jgi:hypothetical protein